MYVSEFIIYTTIRLYQKVEVDRKLRWAAAALGGYQTLEKGEQQKGSPLVFWLKGEALKGPGSLPQAQLAKVLRAELPSFPAM